MTRRYERLGEPLVRRGGELRPAGWDEALDAAVAGLRAAIARKGSDGVGILSCSRATNEVNFLAQKLARAVLGTHNVDSCNRT